MHASKWDGGDRNQASNSRLLQNPERLQRTRLCLSNESMHYRQFSISMRSLDAWSTCGISMNLPSLETGMPPIQYGIGWSKVKMGRTRLVRRSNRLITVLPFGWERK